MIYAAALLLGFVAGLRTFTAPAVLYLMRGGIAGYVLGLFAIGEMAGDLLPRSPNRTTPVPLIARAMSGAFVGWAVSHAHGSAVLGALLGAVAAVVGAQLGLMTRLWAIRQVGPLPAALLEDAIAVALAIVAVARA